MHDTGGKYLEILSGFGLVIVSSEKRKITNCVVVEGIVSVNVGLYIVSNIRHYSS